MVFYVPAVSFGMKLYKSTVPCTTVSLHSPYVIQTALLSHALKTHCLVFAASWQLNALSLNHLSRLRQH